MEEEGEGRSVQGHESAIHRLQTDTRMRLDPQRV